MKNLFLLAMTVMLFTACETKDKRYTQQSTEIENVKKHIENYNTKTTIHQYLQILLRVFLIILKNQY